MVLGDDTLSRKGGKSIALASMHHDPPLSSARKPFASFGHVWVVLALWVPLPLWEWAGLRPASAVPLVRQQQAGGERERTGRRQGRIGPRLKIARKAHTQHQPTTKPELLRELVGLLAQWADQRTIYLVVDSAYAGRTLLEDRRERQAGWSRLQMAYLTVGDDEVCGLMREVPE